MSVKWSKEEAYNILKKDPEIRQIVRVAKLMYPGIKVYTSKLNDECFLMIFPEGITPDECEKIGQAVRSDYCSDIAGNDFDYPFFIMPMDMDDEDYMVDITSIDV